MESQQQVKDESLYSRDKDKDFSSGPLSSARDEGDEETDEDELAADDELDEDL
jgi:hypothetical protein